MQLISLFTTAVAAISATCKDYIWYLEGDLSVHWMAMNSCRIPTPTCVSAGRKLAMEAYAADMKAFREKAQMRIDAENDKKAAEVAEWRRKADKFDRLTDNDFTLTSITNNILALNNPIFNLFEVYPNADPNADSASPVTGIGAPPTPGPFVRDFDFNLDFFFQNWFHLALVSLLWFLVIALWFWLLRRFVRDATRFYAYIHSFFAPPPPPSPPTTTTTTEMGTQADIAPPASPRPRWSKSFLDDIMKPAVAAAAAAAGRVYSLPSSRHCKVTVWNSDSDSEEEPFFHPELPGRPRPVNRPRNAQRW